MADTTLMDKLVSLCKRRGFVFQSSEIYGGLGSVWDYGPLGVELKKNVKDRWWRAMVHARDDIEGLDAAILMHPRVWEASGHVAGFTDPLVDCRHCKNRFRADDPRIKGTPGQPDAQCPVCGSKGTLTEPRLFNLMFKTFMGPVEEQAAVVYLRPETAQGIYVNYLNVLQSSRQRIPFGIAQIGKAFRNEITPGNFIFRTREFEQMEMQFFVKPGTDAEWFERWREWRMQWHHGSRPHAREAAVAPARAGRAGPLRARGVRHPVRVPVRLAGDRGHPQPRRLRPRPAPGVLGQEARVLRSGGERALPAVHRRDLGRRGPRGPHAAGGRVPRGSGRGRDPRRAGLSPGGGADQGGRVPAGQEGRHAGAGHGAVSRSQATLPAFYDDSGAIGRRYRRMDEAGTPFGITVDGDTAAQRTVTVRHRDSMQQERVGLDQVAAYVAERIGGE